MEDNYKYLFDPAVGDEVILNYSLDAFKLLVEDKEWSKSILMALDANDFNLYEFRMLIGGLQEYFFKNDIIPDYDVLIQYLIEENKITKCDIELFVGYAEKCGKMTLSDSRIEQIKDSLPLFSIYVNMIRIANIVKDSARDGYTKILSLEQKCDKVIEMAGKLKMLRNNTSVNPHTVEDWC